MRPQLLVLRRKKTEDKCLTIRLHFSVIDLDCMLSYPSNFICLLPKNEKYVLSYSKFSRIFGASSIDTAKGLLLEAIVREKDLTIIEEIKKRLSILSTPHNKKHKNVLGRPILETPVSEPAINEVNEKVLS